MMWMGKLGSRECCLWTWVINCGGVSLRQHPDTKQQEHLWATYALGILEREPSCDVLSLKQVVLSHVEGLAGLAQIGG